MKKTEELQIEKELHESLFDEYMHCNCNKSTTAIADEFELADMQNKDRNIDEKENWEFRKIADRTYAIYDTSKGRFVNSVKNKRGVV